MLALKKKKKKKEQAIISKIEGEDSNYHTRKNEILECFLKYYNKSLKKQEGES